MSKTKGVPNMTLLRVTLRLWVWLSTLATTHLPTSTPHVTGWVCWQEQKRWNSFYTNSFVKPKPYIAGWLWYKCMRRNRGLVNPICPRGMGEGEGRSAPIVFNQGKKHLFSNNSYVSQIKQLRYLNWVIYWENLILGPSMSKSLPPGDQEKAWGQICPLLPPSGSYKVQ